ncbi:MAG: amidohydrolase [Firmicutes bacterium]|nr:amidohydrolase [Bacillota bacterium]
MNETTIIKNADIWTMDSPSRADWIVLQGEKILALGTREGYKAHCSGQERVIDARGNTVLPGFIDNHFHIAEMAIWADFISLEGVRNYQEMGRRIRSAAKKKKGELLIAHHLDSQTLEEGQFPDRTVLDKFCKDRPLAIYSVDTHVIILNTYGILFFKVPFSLKGVELDERGMPTGVFRDRCCIRLDSKITSYYTEDDIRAGMEKMVPQMVADGLTTVAAMEGGNMGDGCNKDMECEFVYRNAESYPVGMELFCQTMDIEYVRNKNLSRIGGALYVDGTIIARTAALKEPYEDAPDKRGVLSIGPEELKDFVAECYEKNIQVSLDAIGDEAIEVSLDAFEYAIKLHGEKDLRGRIEHAQMITGEQIERAARLGVIISMQPAFAGIWQQPCGVYEQRLGQRYLRLNPYRKLLDSGVLVCGGSDSCVTDMNPMTGIHWAVNHPVKEHRITLEEALRMYTVNGAYALFREKELGSLSAGKQADVVILDKCLDEVPSSEIRELKVDTTIKAGRVLFQRR